MSKASELAERLHGRTREINGSTVDDEDCEEAAALLFEQEEALLEWRQRAEVAEKELINVRNDLDNVIEENAKLREALEPFATEADRFEPDEGDDDQPIWGEPGITIGDLRRARAALGKDEK